MQSGHCERRVLLDFVAQHAAKSAHGHCEANALMENGVTNNVEFADFDPANEKLRSDHAR